MFTGISRTTMDCASQDTVTVSDYVEALASILHCAQRAEKIRNGNLTFLKTITVSLFHKIYVKKSNLSIVI